ncbi:PAC2 family protein [Pseudoclavibacter sp. RFBG4]|uniref:proteasome assembly chaperone family protein n=1 Tax=Pseudoclavibacter sp. RFBG4 TaxID=2080575 RepID=UPI000CE75243|nr:PAC2 family protein [Pseudoclavibacter sp. RFBG4]PPG33919.1 PAC2 family protein [Pseudoclavibacter sp. RFBG4]
MSETERIFRVAAAWHDVPAGLPLIVALRGGHDAGAVAAQVSDEIIGLDEDARIVAEFDVDELYDYRARRPIVSVSNGRVKSVSSPRLDLRLVADELGQEFLFLSGFEPDYRWRLFSEALVDAVDALEVSSTTWVHAVPMPVPHTRPIRIAATGNREELVDSLSVWNPTTEAPAHVMQYFQVRAEELGHPVLSLAMLIPHYVADSSVPAGAVAALSALGSATGRMIATEALRERDRTFRAGVDAELESNPDGQKLIHALETQHDAYLQNLAVTNDFEDAAGELPSADQLAAEIERYLALGRDDES